MDSAARSGTGPKALFNCSAVVAAWFAELVRAGQILPVGALIDGEIVIANEDQSRLGAYAAAVSNHLSALQRRRPQLRRSGRRDMRRQGTGMSRLFRGRRLLQPALWDQAQVALSWSSAMWPLS